MIKLTIQGDHISANKLIPNAINKAFRMSSYNAGRLLVNDLREDMKKPKSGKTYRLYGYRKKYHTASSPSETPAIISGRFFKSVNFLVRGVNRMEFGSKGVEYAQYLEEGTRNMQPRKPFERINKKNYNKIKDLSSNYINNHLKQLGFKITKI